MQNVLRAAQRDSLHMDVLDAYDRAESVHRDLGKRSADDYGLTDEQHRELTALAKTAYETLHSMRVITDRQREGDDV